MKKSLQGIYREGRFENAFRSSMPTTCSRLVWFPVYSPGPELEMAVS